MNILFIDNFDSFTYNLVDEFEKRGAQVRVFRNNVDLDFIRKEVMVMKPKLIVLPPGPSSPKEAGICVPLIKEYAGKVPLFGVCLGHQCIVEAFGGKVGRAKAIVHGKISQIVHDGKGVFAGLSSPLAVGRYHSLAAHKVSSAFVVTAKTDDDIIMGVRHKKLPIEGIQFHPESILTPLGGVMIENILARL